MAKSGDKFITTLKLSHARWGTHRHTNTRTKRSKEGYLQIPAPIARALNLTNSNAIYQSPIYNVSTADGFIKNKPLLASGSSKKGYKFAKQFHGKGNLKLLGLWYAHINADIGDQIEIKFLTPTDILLTKI
ncbi:hypothetical protein [Pedobacter namyangjuensis]|uniref:hypothetical protein n=1 Tax=Pedobacter namyangjuensis TaxID=600626 RepID=UPI000DE36416|nr:hypothetical protein [Pedobacter namyangjuensis]